MIDLSKIHTTNASLKIMLIMVVLFAFVFLSMPAKAESGTITILNNSIIDYSSGYTATSTAFHFDQLLVKSTSWNHINSLFVNVSNLVHFPSSSGSTTFTITSGGTGTGTVSFSESAHAVAYYFSSDSTVTGSPLVLNFASNIFAGTAQDGGYSLCTFVPGSVTTDRPVFITVGAQAWAGVDTSAPGCNGAADRTVLYTVQIQNTVSNDYAITYNSTGASTLFETVIHKTSTTNSQVLIQQVNGSNYTLQGDSTFNTVSFDVVNLYGAGIALNASTASGDFEFLIINLTGSSLAPGVTPNGSNPNAANCPVNCIETSKPTYNNTESANIFGSFYPATSTVTDCLFFGFICTDKTISTESTTGYVFISTAGSTSPIKFLSFTPDMHSNYNLFTTLDIGTYQAQLFGFAGPGTTCTSGIVYDFPFVPLGCYYPHNITTFSVVNASGNLSIHWQTKISNSTAIYGDTVTVAWSNVTPNDTVVIYDNLGAISQSYNINQSTVSQIPVFIPLYTIGTWNATIFNASNHNHNATAFLNVVPPGSVDVNNSFGITMYWSKAADVINNPTFLNWNTGTYTGNYNISILQNGNEIRRTSYFGVPGQTQQGSYTFGEQGAYVAQFLDSPNETVQAQADIFISAATSSGGGTGGTTANQSSNNLVGAENQIITLPWIGLMILIVVIFGLWKNSAEPGFAVFVIALTTSIEAVIGLWQNWGIYITVLSWLLVGVFFKLNKSIEV